MKIMKADMFNKSVTFKHNMALHNTNRTAPTYDGLVKPLNADTVNFEKNNMPSKSLKRGFGRFIKDINNLFSSPETSNEYLSDEEIKSLILSRCNLL